MPPAAGLDPGEELEDEDRGKGGERDGPSAGEAANGPEPGRPDTGEEIPDPCAMAESWPVWWWSGERAMM